MAQPADNVDADFADLEQPVVMAQPADNVDADFANLEIGHAVTVKGGCLKKEELLETRRTRCGNTFVKLDKTAPWLSRVVTG